jgi:hypothetical protein
MTRTNPQEDIIIIVDADMIMLKPFDPVKMGVKSGKRLLPNLASLLNRLL